MTVLEKSDQINLIRSLKIEAPGSKGEEQRRKTDQHHHRQPDGLKTGAAGEDILQRFHHPGDWGEAGHHLDRLAGKLQRGFLFGYSRVVASVHVAFFYGQAVTDTKPN